MRFFLWLKKETLHLIPAFLFFFIAFNIINLTIGMILKKEGVSPFSLLTIFLASIVVGKVLLIVDNLSLINLFPRRPLMYNVVWKTFVYSLAALLIRLIGHGLRFVIVHNSWTIGYEHFLLMIHSPIFWAVQIWYGILFGIFVIFREFVYVLGAKKVRKLFLG